MEFASERDMKSALEKLNGVDLDGRRINLIRQRFRSRLGSKSRSRSPRSKCMSRLPRSKSRSRSPRSRSRHRSPRSRSRSQSRSESRSRSQSPAPKVHFRSRSKDDIIGQKITKAIFLPSFTSSKKRTKKKLHDSTLASNKSTTKKIHIFILIIFFICTILDPKGRIQLFV